MTAPNYREIIAATPELAKHIAEAITSTSAQQYSDTASAPGARDPMDALAAKLDDLRRLLAELGQSVDYWQQAMHDDLEPLELPDAVATATREALALRTDSTPAQAVANAHTLAGWLLANWEHFDGHPLHSWWLDSLDDWLLPQVRRLLRHEKPPQPRRCHACHALAMHADTQHASARCELCGHIARAEIWLSITEAARRLDVTTQTVRNWIDADSIDVRGTGRQRRVELTQCRAEQDYRAARQRAGLQKGTAA